MIFATITLPHCWVCGARFNDLPDNPGSAMREEHHVVPRAAGGADGPTVSLCETHHQMLHKVSAGKEPRRYLFHPLIQALPSKEQQQKVVYLATVAHNAFAATKDDPNKKRRVEVGLDAQTQQMLDQLRAIYKKGNEALLKHALAELHKRHFLKRTQ
ncbi:endonuclease [Achromobacter phage Motura]|uniref:Endonuclease n=1 Tax=Achromobacter phage Motura TaxID=2591403 RepID=A0A514CSN8_9CAUD|nr:endonuclease [Achromobacter phage Motura]QDH83480.1 endonuclease [Achromobacter phage Motura]